MVLEEIILLYCEKQLEEHQYILLPENDTIIYHDAKTRDRKIEECCECLSELNNKLHYCRKAKRYITL